MMKVLHFFKTYYPETHGGIEEVIYQLAEHSPQYGIDAQVLALSRKGSARAEKYHHHIVHRAHTNLYLASTSFSWSAFRDFAELARDADLIHYHFPWPFADLVHFAVRTGKPTLVTYHSDIIRQQLLKKLYRPLQDRFLGSVDHIVATSPNYAASSPVLSRFKNKLSIIPIGVQDTSVSIELEPTLLKSWQERLPERFFLFLGALRYYKGLPFLLEAAHATGYPIVIAGDGPDEQALKAQATQLGLDRVMFTGAVSDQDKAALLRLCYAFVFPSHVRSEAFGIALLEAAMHGKAMISCEIGTGTSYINLNEVTGLTIPGANSDALTKAMQRLWLNPEETAQYGGEARRRYLELFTVDAMTRCYAELYRRLEGSH
jgi:rhamnosyl/mannosyltransferase